MYYPDPGLWTNPGPWLADTPWSAWTVLLIATACVVVGLAAALILLTSTRDGGGAQ